MKTMIKILCTGWVGVFLVCFLISGCGGGSESPEPETEGVVRQIVPDAERQPEEKPGPERAPEPEAVPPEDQPAEVSEEADEAADASDMVDALDVDEDATIAVDEDATIADDESKADKKVLSETTPETKKETSDSIPVEETAPLTSEPDSKEKEAAMVDSGVEPTAAPVIELDLEAEGAAAGDPDGAQDEKPETAAQTVFNPFIPLFKKETTSTSEMGRIGGRAERKFLTPLERIDLNQLQLDGIILAQSGNRAIVSDATGKGYVIRRGTYVGLNSGVVDTIEGDRVVVVEEIGNRAQKVVLKLQKPAGE